MLELDSGGPELSVWLKAQTGTVDSLVLAPGSLGDWSIMGGRLGLKTLSSLAKVSCSSKPVTLLFFFLVF